MLPIALPRNRVQKCSRPLADLLPPVRAQNYYAARRRLPPRLRFVTLLTLKHGGEMSERFKEHAWKACVGEILPWVRIPLSPPHLFFPSLLANRRKTHDLSQVQRAARRQARSRRAEIPATPRVSRARLAARTNHIHPHALPQRPPRLVTLRARIRRPPSIESRMKSCPQRSSSKEPTQPS